MQNDGFFAEWWTGLSTAVRHWLNPAGNRHMVTFITCHYRPVLKAKKYQVQVTIQTRILILKIQIIWAKEFSACRLRFGRHERG
jgi:hypothetical protein